MAEDLRLNLTLPLYFGEIVPNSIGVPIYGYIVPVLALIAVCGNGVVVRVISRPDVVSHARAYLITIAIVDGIAMTVPAAMRVYIYTFNNYTEYMQYRMCFWYYVTLYIIPDSCNMASVWTTVMLAFVRFRCVCFPLSARRLQSSRMRRLHIAAIFVLTSIVYVPSAFVFTFHPAEAQSLIEENRTVIGCKITSSDIFRDHNSTLRRLHLWMEVIIGSLFPCMTLVILDIAILQRLRIAAKKRHSLQCSSPNFRCSNRSDHSNFSARIERDNHRLSWMIFSIVALVCLNKIPSAIDLVYRLVTTKGELPLYLFGVEMVAMCLWLSVTYPLIFFIYCTMSAKFRSELTRFLCNKRTKAENI